MPMASPDNPSLVVSVVTLFLLVATVVTVIARTAMRWALTRKTHLDDAVIILATGLATAQSIVIVAGVVPNGLGQRHDLLSSLQRSLFQKHYYAAVLLYIPCICVSNLAVLFLLRTITPVDSHRRLLVAAGTVTVAWGTAAEMASAFQCKLPTPWTVLDGATQTGQCFDITAFWYCFGVVQLLIDIALVILPWIIVRHVHMSAQRKHGIIGCFATRLLVIVAVVAQLVYFNSATKSNDMTFNLWAEVVCSQVVQSLSIITTCVPHLKSFFDRIESGMLRNDDLRRRGSHRTECHPAARSRQSSSAAGPVKEVMELSTHLDELPRRSSNTGQGVIPIGMRLSQQAGPSRQLQSPRRPTLPTALNDGPGGDGDSLTSQPEILRKPSRARLLPPDSQDIELIEPALKPQTMRTGHRSADDHDREELARLGKKQVLKRDFGFMSMLGFSCTILITWEGLLIVFIQGLANGGPAGLVYGYLLAWLGTLAVFTTIAELASMAPTSSGQCHWVAMLAPPSCRKFLSYLSGWLTVAGWQAFVAAACYLSGTLVQGLVVLQNPGYRPRLWHGTLLSWAVAACALFVNTVVGRALPKLESAILVLHMMGFLGVLIPLMSEEIQNPSKIVPASMLCSVFLNGTLGFGMLLAVLFCIGSLEAAIESPTGYPFMDIFRRGTGSPRGSAAMIAIIIVLSFCATIAVLASSSRLTRSFARTRGLPGWRYLSSVEPRTSLPLAAVGVTSTVAMLLSLISIGSTVALNNVLSLTVASLFLSYLACCSLLLWRRCTGGISKHGSSSRYTTNPPQSSQLMWGPFHVPGIPGIAINVASCSFLVIIIFFSFWPPVTPVTPATMNYSVLVTGFVLIFSAVYYVLWAHRTYTGPVVEVAIFRVETSTVPAPQFPAHQESRVWLLSSGASPIGVALARQLLTHGDHVVFGTKAKEVSDPNSQRAADFSSFWTEEVLVKEAWKDRAKVIGLDGRPVELMSLLAGLAIIGTVEELGASPRTCALIRDQFETNYFGHINLIKAALPPMRHRGRGHIILLTGIRSHPDESQSLAYEIAPFNIRMTIVQPNIEINVLTNQITTAPQLPQYAPENNAAPFFREIAESLLERLEAVAPPTVNGVDNGRLSSSSAGERKSIVSDYPQLSEQMKNRLLAETIHALTAIGGHENPPARHIVGHEAVGLVREKLKMVSEELEDFGEVSYAVDLDGDNASSPQRMSEGI
ncbi:MAG: hypothetical protein Q9173_001277 [Seirophora scorigena]